MIGVREFCLLALRAFASTLARLKRRGARLQPVAEPLALGSDARDPRVAFEVNVAQVQDHPTPAYATSDRVAFEGVDRRAPTRPANATTDQVAFAGVDRRAPTRPDRNEKKADAQPVGGTSADRDPPPPHGGDPTVPIPPGPVLLLGPQVDTASWRLPAPAGGWGPIAHELRARVRRGERAAALIDQHGSPVEVEIELERGALVVWGSGARIEILGKWADAQIGARATWTEGIERWALRVLPMLSFWLLGREPEQDRSVWLWLRAIGWRAKRIDPAFDFAAWPIDPDLHKLAVTRLFIRSCSQGGVVRGIEFGLANKNDVSAELYDKRAKIESLRGDVPAGYLHTVTAAGWDGLGPLTRLELRLQGKALVLVSAAGEPVDGTVPWAPCDRTIISALASYALQAIWLADPSGRADRPRDRVMHPGWALARDAALAGAEPVKLSRATVSAEIGSVTDHARARLLRASLDVGVLAGGTEVVEAGRLAVASLREQLEGPEAVERFLASRARYAALLEAVSETETERSPGND